MGVTYCLTPNGYCPVENAPASRNCIAYFNLNLNELTPAEEFIMAGFNNKIYYTDIYAATLTAQQLKTNSLTYCFKYIPKPQPDKVLYSKIYNQNDLVDLAFVAQVAVTNPGVIKAGEVFEYQGRRMVLDETDISFVNILKQKEFYQSLYASLDLALDYRGRGKYYCYYLKTPKYLFPKNERFNEKIEGQTLILLWYNREYLLKKNHEMYKCK